MVTIIANVSRSEESVVRNIKLADNFILVSKDISTPLKFSESLLRMLGIPYIEKILQGDLIYDTVQLINSLPEGDIAIAVNDEEFQFLKVLYALAIARCKSKILYNGLEIGKISDLNETNISKDDIRTLGYIYEGITISKLAKLLNTSVPTAWRKVSELEIKGLIEKMQGKGIKLTTKGLIISKINLR